MKIDNTGKSIGSAQGPAGPRAGTAARPIAADAVAGAPSSAQAATVVSTSLHAMTGSEAAFNSQKVAEIRQAISEGKFRIDPERIADGLISSVREMLDPNRRPT
jgi:negative regulator of flagellin synthesis FlgM